MFEFIKLTGRHMIDIELPEFHSSFKNSPHASGAGRTVVQQEKKRIAGSNVMHQERTMIQSGYNFRTGIIVLPL